MKHTNETYKKGTVRARARMAGRILLGLVAVTTATVVIVGLVPIRGPRTTTGRNRVLAQYATIADGVRLAVYIALPADLGDDGQVPTILESTRYGTMPRPTFAMRVLGRLGIAKLGIGGKPTPFPSRLDFLRLGAYGHGVGAAMDAFLNAGYAFAMASSRGSGASFGERPIELSREEVADQGKLIQWIAAQDWSDGKVGAYGVSYSGNTAELACASAPAALVAAAPFYSDFDPIGDNVLPGGILNVKLLQDWNEANLADDVGNNDNALLIAAAPVDGWNGGRLRKQAYASHKTLDLFAALRNVTALDVEFTKGYAASDIASASYREAIAVSGIPLRVRAGWLDASTAGGALERFLSFANAQELDIGPWGHGGFTLGDPFLGITAGRPETEKTQAAELVAYFDRYLRESAVPPAPEKILRYYTYGTGRWTTTGTWPPEGVRPRRFRFGPGRTLVAEGNDVAGSNLASGPLDRGDSTNVDFSASTGETNRWRTNLGGGAVIYPDRRHEDEKLLYWDSAPLQKDQEITGSPWVSLWIESNALDGAFHVYLEDVAPDGTVSYITEGMLRALHRKPLDRDPLAGALGPRHSFLASDTAPLVPGEAAELRIALEPISVMVRSGHRIRIAVAGADASNFVRIPAEGNVRITVLWDREHPSFVELPFMQ